MYVCLLIMCMYYLMTSDNVFVKVVALSRCRVVDPNTKILD